MTQVLVGKGYGEGLVMFLKRPSVSPPWYVIYFGKRVTGSVFSSSK